MRAGGALNTLKYQRCFKKNIYFVFLHRAGIENELKGNPKRDPFRGIRPPALVASSP